MKKQYCVALFLTAFLLTACGQGSNSASKPSINSSIPQHALIQEITDIDRESFAQNTVQIKQKTTIIYTEKIEETVVLTSFYDAHFESDIISISEENSDLVDYHFNNCVCHYSIAENHAYFTNDDDFMEVFSSLMSFDNDAFNIDENNCYVFKESTSDLAHYQVILDVFPSLFNNLTDNQFIDYPEEILSLPASITFDVYAKNNLYVNIDCSFSFSVQNEKFDFAIAQEFDYQQKMELPEASYDAYKDYLKAKSIIEADKNGFISEISFKNKGKKITLYDDYSANNTDYMTHYKIGDPNKYTECKYDNSKYIVTHKGSSPNVLTIYDLQTLQELYAVVFKSEITYYSVEKGVVLVGEPYGKFHLYALEDFSPIAYLEVLNPLLFDHYILYKENVDDAFNAVLFDIDSKETTILQSVSKKDLSISEYTGEYLSLNYYFYYFKKENTLLILDDRKGDKTFYIAYDTTTLNKIYEGSSAELSGNLSDMKIDHQFIATRDGFSMMDVTNGTIVPRHPIALYPYIFSGEFEDYTALRASEINDRFDLVAIAIETSTHEGSLNRYNQHYRIYDKQNNQWLFKVTRFGDVYWLNENAFFISYGDLLISINLSSVS